MKGRMNCNHTVVKQESFLFTIDELPDRIKDEVHNWNNYDEIMSGFENRKKKLVKPLDFLDGRKGYMNLFCYCPDCGEKIGWKMIKEMISNRPY